MTERFRSTCRLLRAALLLAVLCACGVRAAAAQHGSRPPKPLPAPALSLTPLVGMPIPILPATFMIVDSGVTGLPAGRVERLAWADSVLLDALQAHGPEANWIAPAELRRVAKRAPGIVTDPDHMSQSALRFESLKRVPDPILSNIRALVALTNSRYVMVPASIRVARSGDSVQVTAILVLADARSGVIPWWSAPVATRPTAGAALAATIAWILPDAQ